MVNELETPGGAYGETVHMLSKRALQTARNGGFEGCRVGRKMVILHILESSDPYWPWQTGLNGHYSTLYRGRGRGRGRGLGTGVSAMRRNLCATFSRGCVVVQIRAVGDTQYGVQSTVTVQCTEYRLGELAGYSSWHQLDGIEANAKPTATLTRGDGQVPTTQPTK